MEIPLIADLIFQEAAIRLLDPLGEIAEEDEGGDDRLLEHGDILDFDELTLIAGRGSYGYLLEHIGVELRCGDEPAAVFVDLGGSLEHVVYALLSECRSEDDGEIGEGGEPAADGVDITLLSSLRAVGHEVPLIDTDHESLAVALDKAEDVGILRLDASGGVDHQDADIRSLDGADRTDHRIILDILIDLLLLADAGGVDQIEVETELIILMIDRIAGGAGDIGDDVTFLADECIDERRLSGVGTTDDSELGDIIGGFFHVGGVGHLLEDNVEEVAGAGAIGRRDFDGSSEAEGVELGGVEMGVADIILVGNDDHRLLRAAQDGSHLVVEVGDAGGRIDHEEDYISLFDGDMHLLIDLLFEDIIGIDHPAAGVDDRELAALPVDLAILAVACGAGSVIDDGAACLRQTVEEGRLPYIGSPYYCY